MVSIENFKKLNRAGRKSILAEMHQLRIENTFGTVEEKERFFAVLKLYEDAHHEEKETRA